MKVLDNGEFEKYKVEAQEKWGKTEAYREYSEKTKTYSPDQWKDANRGLDSIFGEFALCMKNGKTPDSFEVQDLVRKLQDHITGNYYTCTKPILAGLGQMYVADDCFCTNIDRNGKGTAEFASAAILAYCSNE